VAGLPGFHGGQIGAQVGEAGPVQLVAGVEVIPGFGDGEADDARGRVGGHRHQRGQVLLVGQHALDGRDACVAALALRCHGFQRVGAALRLQRGDRVQHVGTQVAAGDAPAGVTQLTQLVDIDGLVRAVERAQAQVQDGVHGEC